MKLAIQKPDACHMDEKNRINGDNEKGKQKKENTDN